MFSLKLALARGVCAFVIALGFSLASQQCPSPGLLQEWEEGPVLQGQRVVKVCPHRAEVGGTDLGRQSHAQCSKLAMVFGSIFCRACLIKKQYDAAVKE